LPQYIRMEEIRIIDTTEDNILELGICGYKSRKREGFPEKVAWMKERFRQGLRIKTLYSPADGNQGMIEYIPGEYAWRPVEAEGYLFVHCLFLGFKKEYKGKGLGSRLLSHCIDEAKDMGMKGVASVTREGSFMAGSGIFLKNGFRIVDRAAPDFSLAALIFEEGSPPPRFKPGWDRRLRPYARGLTIIRADQCPYTVKNVREIVEAAAGSYGLEAEVITLKTHEEAQESPSPFGIFCIILDGRILAHHPISKRRFMNIMDSLHP
jgi:GNAT superfamily N-acetyltransferase